MLHAIAVRHAFAFTLCVHRCAEEIDGLLDSVSRLRGVSPPRRPTGGALSTTEFGFRADGWRGSPAHGRASLGSGGWQAERGAQTDSPARSTRSAQCEDEREWDRGSTRGTEYASRTTAASGPGPGPGLETESGMDAGVWTGPGGRARPGMSAQLDLSRSQIWEELAEAHLNQLIGQTDMLLASLSTPDDDQYDVSIDIDEHRVTTSIDVAAPDEPALFSQPAAGAAADASPFRHSTRGTLDERAFGSRGPERRSWRERMQRSTRSLATEALEEAEGTARSPASSASLFSRRTQLGGAAAHSMRNSHFAARSIVDGRAGAEASATTSGFGSAASLARARLPTDQLRSLLAVRTQMVRSTRVNAPRNDLSTELHSRLSRHRHDTRDLRQRQPLTYNIYILTP